MTVWDLAVIGAGPAGLSAAHAAAGGRRPHAGAGAGRPIPRYKTCGGGLIGTSLAAVAGRIDVPAHDRVDRVTFTRDGRRDFTRRRAGGPLVAMVRREEFDDRLREAAVAAGRRGPPGAAVRAVEQDPDEVRLRLADGETVTRPGGGRGGRLLRGHRPARRRPVPARSTSGWSWSCRSAPDGAGPLAGPAAAGLGSAPRLVRAGSSRRATG